MFESHPIPSREKLQRHRAGMLGGDLGDYEVPPVYRGVSFLESHESQQPAVAAQHKVFLSDNGTKLKNRLVDEYLASLGIFPFDDTPVPPPGEYG